MSIKERPKIFYFISAFGLISAFLLIYKFIKVELIVLIIITIVAGLIQFAGVELILKFVTERYESFRFLNIIKDNPILMGLLALVLPFFLTKIFWLKLLVLGILLKDSLIVKKSTIFVKILQLLPE